MNIEQALQRADEAIAEASAENLVAWEEALRSRGASDEEIALECERIRAEHERERLRVLRLLRAVMETGSQPH